MQEDEVAGRRALKADEKERAESHHAGGPKLDEIKQGVGLMSPNPAP